MTKAEVEPRSEAPTPPNFRKATEGSDERCGTCEMHDPIKGVCWGYGNYPVATDEVCDSYYPEDAHRSLLMEGNKVTDELWSDDEWRAAMSSAAVNDLPDSAFAYIEDGGEKDDEGKTTPRSKRHFPIHDAAHVRNALARLSQSPFGEQAKAKVMAAAKKFGIEVGPEHKSEAGEVADGDAPDRGFNITRSKDKKPRHRSGLPNGLEVRHFPQGLELRDDGTNALQLVGTPIVYGTAYSVRDMFGTFQETMHPGVVSDLLATGCDTRFLFNHGGLPLARTISGTLTLEDSERGLTCIANLDARQQLATDLAVAVERGDVTQMSVGMIVGDDKWDARQENRDIYKLKDLTDVSAVTYPASPTTNIEVAQRMLAEMPVESRDRVRRMWAITRDLHDGQTVDPSAIDVLSDGLRALATADETLVVDEERAEPTPQDKGIAKKIQAAHQAVTDAIHAQMGDPDGATDPVDDEVMSHLHDMAKAGLKAIAAQAKDGASDMPPMGGPTGDQGTEGLSGQGALDAAGDTRSEDEPEPPKRMTTAELRRQMELISIDRKRREREHRSRVGAA